MKDLKGQGLFSRLRQKGHMEAQARARSPMPKNNNRMDTPTTPLIAAIVVFILVSYLYVLYNSIKFPEPPQMGVP